MNASARPRRRRVSLLPYLLILPTFVFVALFTIWPMLLASYQSLFLQRLNIARFRTPTFIGAQNYIDLFGDDRFHQVMVNTLLYVLGTVPLSVVLGFLFALLVNRAMRGIGLARLFFFYPTILPLVSAATIWMFFFTPDYGIFNTALRAIGYTGPQNWTSNPNLALISVMIVTVWKNAGYYMIFYLAGLQGLPQDVFEAAALDGASGWQMLWRITFPLLRRTTLFVTTIAFISAFQTVDHIFVLTQGGPAGASSVLLYYLWEMRFEFLNVGAASALTVVLILVLLVFTLSNFLISEQREDAYAK
ncbi:MAG: sugar ABC transporter permease [Caldilinea sp.]|nr:sugar ABC transporter permease [Caldilinea sp.]MCB9115660.1 sugar ABC transporter permease [Caldilineaceae bacterium]MCB9121146.1 sugar ABC transporter permease [Caldilineaceae bacterium]MCB9123224.1 sugar ABC transporter permease [Caldilineaceae bacterium]MCO5212439.1 sugar ABC transporter permease [Caldilinea sp.]